MEYLDKIAEISQHTLAPTTRETYDKLWKYFDNWCQDRGLCPLPADPIVIQAYLAQRAEEVSISMVLTATAAIRHKHISNDLPSPLENRAVKRTIAGLKRRYQPADEQVSPLTHEELKLITAAAYQRKPHENARQARRRASTDIALINVMRDAMLRRSEAAAVCWGDLAVESNGTASLTLRISKTDRVAKSTVLFLSQTSQTALEKMLHHRRGKEPQAEDRIFNLSGRQICNRIEQAAELAELTGRFRGHSPRIGMAIDLASDDVELAAIMQAGRWVRPETMVRYIRSIAAGKGAVARWHERHGKILDIKTF